MADANEESATKVDTFHVKDKSETAEASTVMAAALASDQGVVIVDS